MYDTDVNVQCSNCGEIEKNSILYRERSSAYQKWLEQLRRSYVLSGMFQLVGQAKQGQDACGCHEHAEMHRQPVVPRARLG